MLFSSSSGDTGTAYLLRQFSGIGILSSSLLLIFPSMFSVRTRRAARVCGPTANRPRNSWFRSTVLAAIALTRQQEATDRLIDLIANDDAQAAGAHEARCRSAPSAATQDRLKQLGRPCVQARGRGTGAAYCYS